MDTKSLGDVPLTVVGGRGPHGLALHLWLRDRGINEGYALVDAADDWLPLYGPGGPMQAVGEPRSPRELDFSLGCDDRAMTRFTDPDGSRPLEHVYPLRDAACETFNLTATPAQRASRLAFWHYADRVARDGGADAHVAKGEVVRLEPYSVPVESDNAAFGMTDVARTFGGGGEAEQENTENQREDVHGGDADIQAGPRARGERRVGAARRKKHLIDTPVIQMSPPNRQRKREGW